MVSNYIVSTGTSIFTNFKKFFNAENLLYEFKKIDKEEDTLIKEEAKKVFDQYKSNINKDNLKEISAEIKGIESINPPIDYEKDRIFLISTYTPEGIAAAYLNKFIFEEFLNIPSENIKIEIIKGTDVRSRYNIFKTQGIPNLFNTVAKIKEESKEEGRNVYINISGGYKPISTMLTVAGMLLEIEVHYVHEEGDLIRIPTFPIDIDWEELENSNIYLLKKLFRNKISEVESKELEKNDIVKMLILDKEDKTKISEMGKILLSTFFGLVNDSLCSNVLRRDKFEKFVEYIINQNHPNYMLAIFDLDKFKNINDTFGHSIGDEALKAFAEAIDSIDYEYKMFGRIGGDEFMGIFWNLGSLEEGEKILKEIQQKVKSTTLKGKIIDTGKEKEFSLSTTIGSIYFKNKSDFEELKKQADDTLMKLKKEDRRGVYELLKLTE